MLVLGSMPGRASLAAGRYYAHPRNAFWRIISDALGGGKDLSYGDGIKLLKKNRVALWDVLRSCVRPGSADSAIVSEEPNDIAGLLAARRGIVAVLFNGAKAEASFRRWVLPSLPPGRRPLMRRLPSTSPANASVPYACKLAAWRRALAGK